MRVIATAGHVDHGKSTLVHALTGVNPDRFAEETRRGMTIDLGFAHCVLPSGRTASFVDVPGHVRYLHNMLAGVGPVDACLFVVAATEGWKRQSEEHLLILQLLGFTSGVVALTHAASASAEQLERVRDGVSHRLADTFLAGAPLISVDIPASLGLEELRAGLDGLIEQIPAREDRGRPRFWIDRSFSIRGAGPVVTGTLIDGLLFTGDEIEVLGGNSGVDKGLRVRGLQSHGAPIDSARPGHRVAINIVGAPRDELRRGNVLVHGEQWHHADTIDASFEVLDGLNHRMSRRGSYLFYSGTCELGVRIRVLGKAELEPGEKGMVRVYLPVRLPLLPGDRYVLRESGRAETVGGGVILDVDPILPASKAKPSGSIDQIVRERGLVEVSALERLTGVCRDGDIGGRWVVDQEYLLSVQNELIGRVRRAGAFGLDLASEGAFEKSIVEQCPELCVEAGRAYLSSEAHRPTTEKFGDHPWLAELAVHIFDPPDPKTFGISNELMHYLVQHGKVIKCGGEFFSPMVLDRTIELLTVLFAETPEGVSVAAVRNRLGTSRKYTLAILEHLDGLAVTRRRGDVRVPGPRFSRKAHDRDATAPTTLQDLESDRRSSH